MPNRLAHETSLYLRQHCQDPVDWYSWSDEAFAEAKKRNVPVFLSIGYSSCHWCHVMAHESFQDKETAEVLNKNFVCIKVDREERPDVDDAYMTAVQLATGHGGWPITVFMTPGKEPFFAGTYFPKESRGDFPGFRHLAASLGQAWIANKGEIVASAGGFAASLRDYLAQTVGPSSPNLELALVDGAVEALHGEFDFENGGFGTRPKFPPHATLRFLLDYASRRHLLSGDVVKVDSLTEQAGHMALMTLEKMASGGIHDHVGGGFHRYSTDEQWVLPHFEKMLSDNALLIALYSEAAKSCGDPRLQKLFMTTADKAVAWVEETLSALDGTFWTSVDADSVDGEGTYYTWTLDEIKKSLPMGWERFAEAFSVVRSGNFLDEASHKLTGRNVLYLESDSGGGFDDELLILKKSRIEREHPSIDNKSVASLNGLMLGALVRSGRTERAKKCADAWCRAFETSGHVPHLMGKGLGFLDDYAYLANGLIDLAEEAQEVRWRKSATRICEQMVDLFKTGDKFTYASGKHEELFGRSVPAFDGSVPSPLAEAARAMFRLGRHNEARETIMGSLGWLQRTTRAAHSLIHLAFIDFLESPDATRTIQHSAQKRIELELQPREAHTDKDGFANVEAVLSVPNGMHIVSSDPTAKWLTATTLRVDGAFAEASFPNSQADRYEGEVRIPVRLRPKAGTSEYQLTVRYQLCSEKECFLPDEATVIGRVIVP